MFGLIICMDCYEKKNLVYLDPGMPDENGTIIHTCPVCGHKEVTIPQELVGVEDEEEQETEE